MVAQKIRKYQTVKGSIYFRHEIVRLDFFIVKSERQKSTATLSLCILCVTKYLTSLSNIVKGLQNWIWVK